MRDISKLEKELVDIVNMDKNNWTHFYLIMKDIEENSLWQEVGERSFTSWVKNFCIKNSIHESIIWNRKKAGKVYESYQRIKEEQGVKVAPIEKANVSVDTLVLLDKINKKSPELASKLTDKAIHKEITREDLRNTYKSIRGDIGSKTYNWNKTNDTDIDDNLSHAENEIEKALSNEINITAPLIVNALSSSEWLGVTKARKPFKTAFEQDKYRTFTEFPLYTGTSKKSRRIDVLICENLTGQSWELNLHGVEIKVSKSDLLNDTKYSEYADFVDYMWLAIPKELIEVAKDNKFNSCGILVINGDNSIEIIEQATKIEGLLKKDTLTSIVLKIL